MLAQVLHQVYGGGILAVIMHHILTTQLHSENIFYQMFTSHKVSLLVPEVLPAAAMVCVPRPGQSHRAFLLCLLLTGIYL